MFAERLCCVAEAVACACGGGMGGGPEAITGG